MGAESPQARESWFRAWWNKLGRNQRLHEIRSGHVRMNLPAPPSKPERKQKRTREHQGGSAVER